MLSEGTLANVDQCLLLSTRFHSVLFMQKSNILLTMMSGECLHCHEVLWALSLPRMEWLNV